MALRINRDAKGLDAESQKSHLEINDPNKMGMSRMTKRILVIASHILKPIQGAQERLMMIDFSSIIKEI